MSVVAIASSLRLAASCAVRSLLLLAPFIDRDRQPAARVAQLGYCSLEPASLIVERLHAEVEKALADPGVKEKLARLGADPMTMKPAEFEAFVKREMDLNAELVKAAGVQVN